MSKLAKGNPSPSENPFPPLEKVYVSHNCQFTAVEINLTRLQRNQERIYALLQVIAEKLCDKD